jgi:hypothetical protein
MQAKAPSKQRYGWAAASCFSQGRPSNFKGPWASKTKGANDNFLI